MFTVISMMFGGIGIGYLFRNLKFLQNVEKTTSLTIFLLLFILGSMLASFLVFRLFFRKGGKK